MRIAIDIRKINQFGIGTYIWNLIRNLGEVDTSNEYRLIGSDQNFQDLGTLPPNFKQLVLPEEDSAWRDHIVLPMALRKHAVDIVHVTHHESPIAVPTRLVVTIHDCVHILFPPENFSRFHNYRRYLRTKRVVNRADKVIAVSDSTKDDLISIFNLPPSKISVIHNALDDRFTLTTAAENPAQVLERYQLKDPFILYSGRIRPHKNLHRLIEAFAVLKNELGNTGPLRNLKLIIIGDELSQHQYLRLTVVRSGVQQDVRFFGFVPYPVLRVFYQSAAMFAFPSLYEGFGLPPLEAMANRTAVLASNTSSLPEVLEDAALLVNPENVFEIARGMKTILLDDTVRQRLIEKGVRQVTKFSWHLAAKRVVETYEQAVRGN
jgi:glycosyltransferase involved in cell wall biosynthesis